MNNFFTEYAIGQQNEIKKGFSSLWKFYDEFCGNFGFTEEELKENMNDILKWLKTHKEYMLIYQYDKSYDGICWWLTDFTE